MRNKRDKNMALSDRLLRGHADRHPSGAADVLPAEGRSRAQKRGQRMGRKPKLTEPQQDEARKRRAVPRLPNSHAAMVSAKARFRGWQQFHCAAQEKPDDNFAYCKAATGAGSERV